MPTPLLYWSLHHLAVVGGIQITGSHNPPEYNGFKLCVGHGVAARRRASSTCYELIAARRRSPTGQGTVRERGRSSTATSPTSSQRIGPLSRAAEGRRTTAATAPARSSRRSCSTRLGVDATCLFCESDGTFPNHHPDPTVPENLADLIAAVKRERAELGIAFDGDADRIGVVDDDGRIIWGDHLLILYARDVLARTGRASRSSST